MHAQTSRSTSLEFAPRPRTASVFIIDQDRSMRDTLESQIRQSGWNIEAFASAEEFLRQRRDSGPGCLVMDVSPALLEEPAFQEIVARRGVLPVVFVTAHLDVAMTVRLMKTGAVDLLTKPLDLAALSRAVQRALNRSRRALAHEATMRELRERYASLTNREREVLALVVTGMLNKQIGAELGISEITVKTHRGKMMRKMAAESLAVLVNMASSLA